MKTIAGTTYVKGRTLGSGAFGTVYRVTRTDNGKTFALKSFSPETEIELGALREISLLKMFQDSSDEGVATLVDIVLTDTKIGVIMKCYLCDLYHAIVTNILNDSKRHNITYQLFKTLAFLQRNNIIHRDIKPENILLDSGFKPVLADYSLSKMFYKCCHNRTHTGNVFTTAYRAPEIVDYKPYGFPADMWSLGVVLYEMFGNHTLDFEDDQNALSFLRREIPRLPDNPLGATVKGLLYFDPHRRLTALQALRGPMFNSRYLPSLLPKTSKKCKVSPEIRDWCEIFEVEREITARAAQIYSTIEGVSGQNAVALASKIYEAGCPDYEAFPEYPAAERAILKAMNYNLFI